MGCPWLTEDKKEVSENLEVSQPDSSNRDDTYYNPQLGNIWKNDPSIIKNVFILLSKDEDSPIIILSGYEVLLIVAWVLRIWTYIINQNNERACSGSLHYLRIHEMHDKHKN